MANYANINGDSKLSCVCNNLDDMLAAEGQGKKKKKREKEKGKNGVGETWISSTVREILLFIFFIFFYFLCFLSL